VEGAGRHQQIGSVQATGTDRDQDLVRLRFRCRQVADLNAVFGDYGGFYGGLPLARSVLVGYHCCDGIAKWESGMARSIMVGGAQMGPIARAESRQSVAARSDECK